MFQTILVVLAIICTCLDTFVVIDAYRDCREAECERDFYKEKYFALVESSKKCKVEVDYVQSED